MSAPCARSGYFPDLASCHIGRSGRLLRSRSVRDLPSHLAPKLFLFNIYFINMFTVLVISWITFYTSKFLSHTQLIYLFTGLLFCLIYINLLLTPRVSARCAWSGYFPNLASCHVGRFGRLIWCETFSRPE